MTNKTLNPYESPIIRRSVKRGLLIAFLLSFAGFALPYCVGLAWIFVFESPSPYRSYHRIDWSSLHGWFFTPGLGCAFVFAMASILNFTPSKRVGFIKALIMVGTATIIGVFVAVFVVNIFDLHRKSGAPGFINWIPTTIAFLIPLGYTIVHTIIECAKKSDEELIRFIHESE